MSDHDRLVESELGHPGFEWLNDAACLPLAEALEAEGKNPMSLFFVDAGHVISDETLNVCRRDCPVRRQCIRHSYVGGPDGGPIAGGYMGGFSLGQRKSLTLPQALERCDGRVRRGRPHA